jgi:Holliday junction DNA helicase RuvA
VIGTIRGTIIEKQPPYLLLEAGGIGYEIAAPMTTFYHLPDIQQVITLYTHLVIREDAHTLYGFYLERDRRLFRTLIKVNGLGPKSALVILSSMESDQFIQCVLHQELKQLTAIPGIGQKTAQRLLIETKDILSTWETGKISSSESNLASGDRQNKQDAISALLILGYKSKEAKKAIDAIEAPDLSSEALIRAALKQMLIKQ